MQVGVSFLAVAPDVVLPAPAWPCCPGAHHPSSRHRPQTIGRGRDACATAEPVTAMRGDGDTTLAVLPQERGEVRDVVGPADAPEA